MVGSCCSCRCGPDVVADEAAEDVAAGFDFVAGVATDDVVAGADGMAGKRTRWSILRCSLVSQEVAEGS